MSGSVAWGLRFGSELLIACNQEVDSERKVHGIIWGQSQEPHSFIHTLEGFFSDKLTLADFVTWYGCALGVSPQLLLWVSYKEEIGPEAMTLESRSCPQLFVSVSPLPWHFCLTTGLNMVIHLTVKRNF